MDTMFDAETFARRIRVALAALNVEQQAAAREMGVDPATLSRICQCRNLPSIETHVRITKWLEKVEK